VILRDILEDRLMQRHTIGLLIAFALAAPLAAAAQPAGKVSKIRFLMSGLATGWARQFEAFTQGLRELGDIEGQTIHLDYRFADEQWDRLPPLAAELVQLKPDVIVTNTTSGVLAARQATTTIPIVMAAGGDLVELGLVASLARLGTTSRGRACAGLS